MNNFLCFDLEGSLSPRNHAYDLMGLLPHGGRLFEVVSRYDDLLTLEGREDYEPGDTLALIVPFLLLHGLREADITRLARAASLTPGAAELTAALTQQGWQLFCITTTYQQYALSVTQRLGLPPGHVAATYFPLDQFTKKLSEAEVSLLRRTEEDILKLAATQDDRAIKARLDEFFRVRLPQTSLGPLVQRVKPIGGRRKLEALEQFSSAYHQPLSAWAVVADSITDFRMLKAVRQARGLAVAFNANQYALPYATAGLASTHLSDLLPLLTAWNEGGLPAAESMVRAAEAAGGTGHRRYFHWLLESRDLGEVMRRHRELRRFVREEAGELG